MIQYTVKELLDMLVGRDSNDVVMIQNNQLMVVQTVPLRPLLKIDMNPVSPERVAQGIKAVRDVVEKAREKNVLPVDVTEARLPADTRNTRRPWTDEDLIELGKRAADGASIQALASVFGRSEKGINMQIWHLKAGTRGLTTALNTTQTLSV